MGVNRGENKEDAVNEETKVLLRIVTAYFDSTDEGQKGMRAH